MFDLGALLSARAIRNAEICLDDPREEVLMARLKARKRKSAAKSSPKASVAAPDHQHEIQDGNGALTALCDCDDRLACRQEPACEQFLQIVRLFGVKDFEKTSTKGSGKKTDKRPVIVAKPDNRAIAAKIAFAMTRSPRGTMPAKKKASAAKRKSAQHRFGVFQDAMAAAQKAAQLAVEAAMEAAEAAIAASTTRHGLPLCEQIELALVIRFEQCWQPLGYSRGELLKSISLAPGEELTLEFFTYDRHRIERERSRESSQETSESGSVTSRISSEVVSQLQFKVGAGTDAKIGGSLSLAALELPIDVNGEIGTNFNTEMAASLTSTRSQLNEATIQASNVLRNSQKTRIVEVSETGTESRSTRRIKNENRCHTINYDYFEISEHFEVRVDVLDAQLVARVPLPGAGTINASWLLCHEYPLRRSLLDPLYEAGFDAAKLIRSAAIYRQLATPPAAPPPSGGAGTGSAKPPDTLGDELRILLDAMVKAKDRLLEVEQLTNAQWGDIINVFSEGHDAAYKQQSKLVTRDYIESVFPGFYDRIDELNGHRTAKGPALFTRFDIFFSQLDATAMVNLVTLAFGGNPELRWDALTLFVFRYDDEGLIGAVDAAQKRIEALRPSVDANAAAAVALPAAPPPAEATAPAERVETIDDKIDREFGLKNLAEAQVELARLICHLQDHLDYYLTVLFLHEGGDAWRRVLEACPHALELVDPRLLAVQDGYAYFPLRREEQERRNVQEMNDRVQQWRDELAAQAGTRVTLSTAGTTLEARLGQCDACEPFIEQHRLHDLELKVAEVNLALEKNRQAQLETERLSARLAQDPPLLDPPDPPRTALRIDLHNVDATPEP
jgi:hypothetical protein